MTARTFAPVLPLVLASSGCLVLDGFGDLEPRAEAASSTSSTTSATTTSTGAGGGDGGAGTTGSTGTVGSTSSGGGAGGGGSGPGGLEQVGDVVRFGATGSPGCSTRVTDVLRIEGATVVAGVTASSGGPCEIVPLEADAVIDFGDAGGRQNWVVVVADDDEVLRVLRLEYADDLAADVSGIDVAVWPVRLHRVDGQPGPIVTRTSTFEGVVSELRVGRLDAATFDLEPLAFLQAVGEVDDPPTAVATEVVGASGRLVVVGALQTQVGFTVTGLNNAPCDASGTFESFDHGFHWDLDDAIPCPLTELPAFVAWSAVADAERVLLGLPAPYPGPGTCDFDASGTLHQIARFSGPEASCEQIVASYPYGVSTPFSLALARTDDGEVVAVREEDDVVRLGTMPEAPFVLSATPGVVDMARLRGAGARHVLGGWFGGTLELDGVATLANDGLRTDGFVAITSTTGAPQLVSFGGDGDDVVTSVDVEAAPDGILAVGGTYGGSNETLGLAAPETTGASYLARYRLEAP